MIKHTYPVAAPVRLHLPDTLQPEDCLFFDIETTGLSPSVSSLYLIGALTCHDGQWTLHQWFADDYESEPAMLKEFGQLLREHLAVIQYNGDRFDIPYLEYKWKQHGQATSFQGKYCIDIYRRLTPCRCLLGGRSLKLKAMEEFLQIPRRDPYCGKELITIYGTYLKSHFMQKEDQYELLAPLLLHNREDILSLPLLTCLEAYPALTEGRICAVHAHTSDSELILEGQLELTIPQPVTFAASFFTLKAEENIVRLIVPFCQGELRYFFSNYKDYYYLPLEDTAIHRSVGEFVDKEFRRKATAATCYVRKSGSFLPVMPETVPGCTELFQPEYRSKERYIAWQDSYIDNIEFLHNYIRFCLKHLK